MSIRSLTLDYILAYFRVSFPHHTISATTLRRSRWPHDTLEGHLVHDHARRSRFNYTQVNTMPVFHMSSSRAASTLHCRAMASSNRSVTSALVNGTSTSMIVHPKNRKLVSSRVQSHDLHVCAEVEKLERASVESDI